MNTPTPGSVRVFVNAVGVDVRAGVSVLDAVRSWNESEADALSRGDKMVTDSRGLPIGIDQRVSAGSIFRLLPVRRRAEAADAENVEGGSENS